MVAISRSSRLRLLSSAGLKGMRITVMGLGTKGGGLEAVKYFVRHKARVLVTDMKTPEQLSSSLDALKGLPVQYILGAHRNEDFLDTDLVIQNPAVPSSSPYLALARKAGIPIETDIALFFLLCPAPVAGITGTRGKTTTTMVAGEILRRTKKETVIAGNVQRSPLADLDTIKKTTPIVLELSSWQLEGLAPHRKSPHWAVFTTFLRDHMNRYASMEEYFEAKSTIYRFQENNDVLVLPSDDALFTNLAHSAKGTVRFFGPATHEKDNGIFWTPTDVFWRRDRQNTHLLSRQEVRMRGAHTERNAYTGALLALEMGAPLSAVQDVLRDFVGVPHRLEVVRTVSGRTFVNDTAATSPDAVRAAVDAFPDNRIVLITGGTDKELDMAPFFQVFADTRVAHVLFLHGSATTKIQEQLSRTRFVNAPVVHSMDDAMHIALSVSLPGDVVLLSPGAASFELFQDEFDRGDQFRRLVAGLPDPLVRSL